MSFYTTTHFAWTTVAMWLQCLANFVCGGVEVAQLSFAIPGTIIPIWVYIIAIWGLCDRAVTLTAPLFAFILAP